MRVGIEDRDGTMRVDDSSLYNIALGGSLAEVLKQLADAGTLVDILTITSPSLNQDESLLKRETHGVRIIMVGEDHVVLGPKRPIFTSFLPLDDILMVRITETQECDEGYIEDDDFDDEFLIPDGLLHEISPLDLEDAIADTSVVVLLIIGEEDNSKIVEMMQSLAEEFHEDALFIRVAPTEEVETEFGVDEVPAVVILSDDEILSQIVGVQQIRRYRKDILDAIDLSEAGD
ncbi:MAG: hypothetical protein JW779_10460 [Candidatus Thorarchaeota archaeon]|nr:hypothetical protein [Candidatus Thorarchaeota archaeon]